MVTLAGKVVVVAGVPGGVFRESALAAGRRGARMVLASREVSSSRSVLSALQAEGIEAEAVEADFWSEEGVARLLGGIDARHGVPDGLVTVAGTMCGSGRLSDVRTAEWEEVVSRNLRALFLLTREFSGAMTERGGGSIVTVLLSPGGRSSGLGGAHNGIFVDAAACLVERAGREPLWSRVRHRLVGLSLSWGAPGEGALWEQYDGDSVSAFRRDEPAGRIGTERDAAKSIVDLLESSTPERAPSSLRKWLGWGI